MKEKNRPKMSTIDKLAVKFRAIIREELEIFKDELIKEGFVTQDPSEPHIINQNEGTQRKRDPEWMKKYSEMYSDMENNFKMENDYTPKSTGSSQRLITDPTDMVMEDERGKKVRLSEEAANKVYGKINKDYSQFLI